MEIRQGEGIFIKVNSLQDLFTYLFTQIYYTHFNIILLLDSVWMIYFNFVTFF